MSYTGFDVGKIRSLARELRKVGAAAGPLHRDLAKVLTDAEAALGGAQPTTSQPLLDAMRGGPPKGLPGDLAASLPSTAGEIDRRCDRISPQNGAFLPGTVVDPMVVFSRDEPDEAKVNRALDALKGLNGKDFGVNGNRDDVRAVAKLLEELTPAELDLLLSKVADGDLKRFGELIGDTGGHWYNLFDENGLPEGERRELLSHLLERAGPGLWPKLAADLPGVQPGFDTTDVFLDGVNSQSGVSTTGLRNGVPNVPLFTDGVQADEVAQGTLGDCWYIASLKATAAADPKFIQDGIRQNANGTISVRVWDKDGKLHWVTMTPDLPLDANGEIAFARSVNGGKTTESWPAYYEKAFALLYADDSGGAPDGKGDDDRYDREEQGDYGAIEWDYTDKAPPYVTGHDTDDIDLDYTDVKTAFESGHPVIVSSHSNADGVPAHLKAAYVTRHVFYVKGFKDGKMILGNPWGPGSPDVVVTPDEFKKLFEDPQKLSVGK
ncbi:C2 family cysteine protease [Microbispora sp. NPDC049125]|uniref:C2 family cysteine protease n=1 Tax=Microbispora sp. NPDC049125 TaxID=3154929 RepID=UPI0034657BAF